MIPVRMLWLPVGLRDRPGPGKEKPMAQADAPATAKGPKYHLDIEGTLHDWSKDTITTEEIIALGGWDPALGAIVIDEDNNERTLKPEESVDLKPGMGFSKKVKFKRG